MEIFFQGLIVGLAYVAPIGLQNLFVINSALTQTRPKAYATALIVVFFDVTLALACFFGIGLLLEQSKIIQMIILLIGGLVVLYIGISLLRSKGTDDTSKDMNMPLIKVISSACVVTWFNPQAIIDGSMFLGASKAALPSGADHFFIIGVVIASAAWFLTITTIVTLFSNKFTPKVLRWINIVCGVIIILYALKLLFNFYELI